jgi:branched-chain amino acid transport system permease protein
MAFFAIVNATIERIAYKPLRHAPRLAPLITAVGVSFIVQNVALAIYGVDFESASDLLSKQAAFSVGSVAYEWNKLVVLFIVVPVLVALTWFVSATRQGKAMRATAQDREAAQLMGININRTIAATFFIGAALAAAGGIIFGLYFNNIRFDEGFTAGLFAFTAAVFGGIGNIQGAALGGLFIGLVQAFSNAYYQAALTDVWIFAILILVLVFRPAGLLGMQVPEK